MLSNAIGIQGLIYGNCINMGIRIVVSLYFAFEQEANCQKKRLSEVIGRFMRDMTTVDVKFIITMIKNRKNKTE